MDVLMVSEDPNKTKKTQESLQTPKRNSKQILQEQRNKSGKQQLGQWKRRIERARSQAIAQTAVETGPRRLCQPLSLLPLL